MAAEAAKNAPKTSANVDSEVAASALPAPEPYKPPVRKTPATTYPDTSMFSTFLKIPGTEAAEEEAPIVYPGGEGKYP